MAEEDATTLTNQVTENVVVLENWYKPAANGRKHEVEVYESIHFMEEELATCLYEACLDKVLSHLPEVFTLP